MVLVKPLLDRLALMSIPRPWTFGQEWDGPSVPTTDGPSILPPLHDRSHSSAGSEAVWSSYSYNKSEPCHKPHTPDLRNAVHLLRSGYNRGTRYVPNDG